MKYISLPFSCVIGQLRATGKGGSKRNRTCSKRPGPDLNPAVATMGDNRMYNVSLPVCEVHLFTAQHVFHSMVSLPLDSAKGVVFSVYCHKSLQF